MTDADGDRALRGRARCGPVEFLDLPTREMVTQMRGRELARLIWPERGFDPSAASCDAAERRFIPMPATPADRIYPTG
jgi:hypothetical protein